MMPMDLDRMYHQQNLQILGVYIPGMESLMVDAGGNRSFRLVRLLFSFGNLVDWVPVKVPAVPADMTPYSFQAGELLHQGEKLTFAGTTVCRAPLPPEESDWHLKGYTFPFQGTRNPYRELRLHLRLSGFCPGKCFFCHRQQRRLRPEKPNLQDASQILDRALEAEGPGILDKVDQVVCISDLFGREDKFLQAISGTRRELAQRGYAQHKFFNCCAQDVRTYSGQQALLALVRPPMYMFSLEFFSNRRKLMGPYKGLPIEKVCEILASARRAGFEELQLNYLAGIDGLEECARGFEQLVSRGLVDSVGLSTFTFFSDAQISCRHATAWAPSYYARVVEILNSLHIKIYHPESFDMGSPYTLLMERTQL